MNRLILLTLGCGLLAFTTVARGANGDLTVSGNAAVIGNAQVGGNISIGGQMQFQDGSVQTSSGAIFGTPDVTIYNDITSGSTYQVGGAFKTLDLSPFIGARRALVYLSIEPTSNITIAFRESGQTKPVGYNDSSFAGWGPNATVISGTEMGYAVVVTNSAGKIDMMSSGSGTYIVKLKTFVTK